MAHPAAVPPMLDLRALALVPGESRRLAVEVPLAPLVLGGQDYQVAPASAPASLELQPTTDGIYMKLAFAASVSGPCVRCLEDARVELRVDAAEYAATRPDPGAEDDLSSEYLADGRLDVEAWARDALVFALPDKILCREECAGLCPHCAQRLEPGVEHACAEPQVDPRWERLREIL